MPRLRRRLSLFSLVAAYLALLAFVQAQSVRWEPSGGSLALNQTSEIQLVFENCEPEGDPTAPSVPGLQLERTGSSMENSSYVNGSFTKSVILGFAARPSQSARLTIPPFAVKTDKGSVTVASATFEVGKAAIRGGSIPLDSIAKAHFDLPSEVWAGEVFPVSYELRVVRRYFAQAAQNFTWEPSPFTVEEWSKGNFVERLYAGERNVSYTITTRAHVSKAGTIPFPVSNHVVALTTGSQSIGFFSTPSVDQFSITSDHTDLVVKPLPLPAAKNFTGAVGKFQLTSKVVPATAQVGEPITWTLTLEGTGNWPDITALPAREVSADFRTVQPQPKRVIKQGKIFDATLSEDVILIPTVPGDYTLNAVTWSYFDPAKGDYVTVTTPSHTLHVAAASALPSATGQGGTPTPDYGNRSPSGFKAPPAPSAPALLPADRVNDSAALPSPWLRTRLYGTAAGFSTLVLAVWVFLAGLRAFRTDPKRPLRAAKKAQLLALQQVEASREGPERAQALLQWQRETAALLGVKVAAPSAKDIPQDSPFKGLWLTTEAALYRKESALPPEWVPEATKANQAHHVDGFKPFSLFHVKNLFPFLVVLAFLLPVSARGADDAANGLYAKGDWSGAAKLWSDAVKRNPANWAAQHNLSLALSQQDQWPEATSHAAIAFVQNPSALEARRQLAYTLPHAGYTPMKIGTLSGDGLRAQVVTAFSPVGWQNVFLCAGGCVALCLCLPLLRAYGLGPRWLVWPAYSGVAAGLLALLAAKYSCDEYGTFADPRAVLTWQSGTLYSLPTEADVEQKTTPLAPGSVAIVDRTFMSWVHLVFPSGESGWAHKEAVEPVWKAPAE